VILGKFFAAGSFFVILLLTTWIPMSVLYIYGSPASGPILTAYLGLLLYGLSIIAIGLFISSLTENQIIAAVISFGAIMLLWLVDVMAGSAESTTKEVLTYLSILSHLDDFTKGVLATSHIIFLLVADAGGIVPDVSLRSTLCAGEDEHERTIEESRCSRLRHRGRRTHFVSIRSIWTPYQTIAVILGGLLVVVSLALKSQEIRAGLGRRSTRFGINSATSVVLLLAVLGLVNYLGAQHVKRVDMTTEKIYSLSEQSANVATQVKDNLQIKAFYPGGDYAPARDLLDLFKSRTTRFRWNSSIRISSTGCTTYKVAALGIFRTR